MGLNATLPLILMVSHSHPHYTANVSERDGAIALLALNEEQFDLVQRVMADGLYRRQFAQSVHAIIGADVIIAKQSDLKNGKVTPQRWVVERSFSWLTNWRRLWFNCERKLNTSKVMVAMAFIGSCLLVNRDLKQLLKNVITANPNANQPTIC
ncbi:transposase [Lactiplantibacillus plantarum]|uniref:transposase n=1 Tax=Lactiplantibacillus plantarum TaxID=1590 RepID=UPI003878FC17